MSPEQKRKKEEARREAIANTYNVCATGEKEPKEYDEPYENQINNE